MDDTLFGRKDMVLKKKLNRPTPTKKSRKIRSDKKHDIKVRLSGEDKLTLKREARKHQLKLTPFLSMLVQSELTKTYAYNERYICDPSGDYVHVKLEKVFSEMIQSMSDEMDITYGEVVYRILKNYIDRISKVKINFYNGG